jgi:hypothetical protein
MSTILVLFFASKQKHKMSTRTSTIYKYVKEHYPISKEHCGGRDHQVENPLYKAVLVLAEKIFLLVVISLLQEQFHNL